MTVTATAFDPRAVYVLLRADGTADEVPVDADFWPAVMSGRRPLDGRLFAAFALDGDIDHWEMHPAGDELLMMISGSADVLFDGPAGVRRVPLAAGHAVLVPRGTWHTFDVASLGTLLAITPGEGTAHRAR